MHSHHTALALALALARVAQRQRAATPATATAPPRRHRRTLALLGLAATAALCALAPTSALAQPIHDAATPATVHFEGGPAPRPAQDPRALAKTSPLAGTTAAGSDTSTSRADALRHAGRGAPAPQDLRSPDARDAATHPHRPGHAPPAEPSIYIQPRALAPVSEQSAARSTSTHFRPIAPAAAATIADHGNGIDWATIALGIAGSLLAVGGIAALANRRNRRHRAVRATH
jgi:hypothetical protein